MVNHGPNFFKQPVPLVGIMEKHRLSGNDTSPTASKSSKSTPGVVLLSRIPPTLTPHELRLYLEPFGKIGRIFFAPDEKTTKKGAMSSKNPRDLRKARFTEGWIEFLRKKDAKTVALALNGTPIGGKKSNRLHDELWNLKYLPDFQWSNLNEASRYQNQVRQQKLRADISQSRKAKQHYIRQSERAVELEKIAETRAKRKAKAEGRDYVPRDKDVVFGEQLEALRKGFKQRKPIEASEG